MTKSNNTGSNGKSSNTSKGQSINFNEGGYTPVKKGGYSPVAQASVPKPPSGGSATAKPAAINKPK